MSDLNLKDKTPREIAIIITKDWSREYFGATPYIQALFNMDNWNDKYGIDSAKSIIAYFLANAQTWRGEIAREVKKFLNSKLK